LRRKNVNRTARQDAGSANWKWVRPSEARQAKSRPDWQRYEELASQEFQKRNETNEIYIPPGDRIATWSSNAKKSQGIRDRLLIENLSFSLPAGGMSASSAEWRG